MNESWVNSRKSSALGLLLQCGSSRNSCWTSVRLSDGGEGFTFQGLTEIV